MISRVIFLFLFFFFFCVPLFFLIIFICFIRRPSFPSSAFPSSSLLLLLLCSYCPALHTMCSVVPAGSLLVFFFFFFFLLLASATHVHIIAIRLSYRAASTEDGRKRRNRYHVRALGSVFTRTARPIKKWEQQPALAPFFNSNMGYL